MIVEVLTLMVTSGFAVTYAYTNIVEQPARMPLACAALLAQWRVSYHRGTAMQLSLAIIAAALAIGSYAATRDWHWLLGARCLLIIAPYTLLTVMPLNRELSALTGSGADERVGPLVRSLGAPPSRPQLPRFPGRARLPVGNDVTIAATLATSQVSTCPRS